MRIGQIAELLRESEAVTDVFGGDEVLGGFNAGVEVEDLMRGAGRYEH